MRDIIERRFGPKQAGAFVMAITLLALPGCAIAPEKHTQGESPTSTPGLKTGSDYLSVCGVVSRRWLEFEGGVIS
jgi:hypothetical protein